RHSTPTLTLGVYAHIGVYDQTAALDALPDLSDPTPSPEAAALAATGTDGGPTATQTATLPHGEWSQSHEGTKVKLSPQTVLKTVDRFRLSVGSNPTPSACQRPTEPDTNRLNPDRPRVSDPSTGRLVSPCSDHRIRQ